MKTEKVLLGMTADSDSPDIVSMKIIEKKDQKSGIRRFVFLRSALEKAVALKETVAEFDLKNVCRIRRSYYDENALAFHFYWLHDNGRNHLEGTEQIIEVPIDRIYGVLGGYDQKCLATDTTEREWRSPSIRFSEKAYERIHKMSPEERKAFNHFMKNAFQAPCVLHVSIIDDPWVNGFEFDDGWSRGGIVPHKHSVKGRDGVVREAVVYGKHT